ALLLVVLAVHGVIAALEGELEALDRPLRLDRELDPVLSGYPVGRVAAGCRLIAGDDDLALARAATAAGASCACGRDHREDRDDRTDCVQIGRASCRGRGQ